MQTVTSPNQKMTNMVLLIFHWSWQEAQLCWFTASWVTTSQVTSSSHLIMTICLIISFWACSARVGQGDLCVPQKCYQHPGCAASDCISFRLRKRRQAAYGRDATNYRPCALWRSAWCPPPLVSLLQWDEMTCSQSGWCVSFEGSF